RNAEIRVRVPPRREGQRRNGFDQVSLDILLGQRDALNTVEALRLLVLPQQLHGTHAIASDRRQQIERFYRSRLEPLGGASADGIAVRKQVVEIIGDLLAP